MKNDPRIIKTINKLEKAFVMLLKTYDVSDINVRQISDEAGVTRGAFYSHFSDKKEFLEFTMESLIQELLKPSLKDSADYVEETKHENAHQANVLSLTEIFNHVAENYQAYTVVMGSDRLPSFNQTLKKRLMEEFEKFADYYDDEIDLGGFPFEVLSSFYVNGIVGMIKVWLEKGMMYTPHYMANAAKQVLDSKESVKANNLTLTDFFVV